MGEYTTEALIEGLIQKTIDGSSNPNTTEVAVFISLATKWVNEHYKVPAGFFDGGATLTDALHDYRGANRLFVKYRPILSVTNCYVDEGGLGGSESWEERTEGRGSDNHFIVYKDKGMYLFHSNVPTIGHQNVKSTYIAGHATLPKDIEMIATIIAGMISVIADSSNSSRTVKAFSSGLLNVTLSDSSRMSDYNRFKGMLELLLSANPPRIVFGRQDAES